MQRKRRINQPTRLLVVSGVLGLIVLAGASVAKGDTITLTGGGSITVSYATYDPNTSAKATISLLNNVLTISLTNTSTAPGPVIRSFGLWPTGLTASGVIGHTEATGYAYLGTPNELQATLWDVAKPNGALGTGQTGVFTLTFTSLQSITFDSAVHIQRILSDGGSDKPDQHQEVPEPSSMILLGFGLVLLGLIPVWHRKR